MSKYEHLFSYIYPFSFLIWEVFHQILWTSWMSFSIIITLFACILHWFAPSMRLTSYSIAAFCKVKRAVALNLNFPFCCWAISLTHYVKCNLWIKNPNWLLKLSNFSQGYSVWPRSSHLLCGEPRCLFVLPLPICFLLFLLPFSVLASLLILALSTFSLSLFLGCISFLPCIQFCCFFFLTVNWFSLS